MIYAIGPVGGYVRMFLDTNEEQRALDQAGEGEVCFQTNTQDYGVIELTSGGYQIVIVANPDQRLAELRAERNALLQSSDWTQFEDSPLSEEKKAEWVAYRAALRAMFEDQPDPTLETVVWPVAPI